MRILFFFVLFSAIIIALIYELDHGLAKGKITIPEQAPSLKDIKPATTHH